MSFLKTISDHLSKNLRILTLSDAREYLDPKNYLKVALSGFLNVANSFAKILAHAALAKGVEMVVLGEKEADYGLIVLTPLHYFYVYIFLVGWVKVDPLIKKALLKELSWTFTEQSLKKLIELGHTIPLENHYVERTNITKLLMEIINSQTYLVNEVITVIHQSLIDILVGTSLIYYRYGKLVGSEFLLYWALDFFLLNSLANLLTKHDVRFSEMNKKMFKFINKECEILNFEETVRLFNHEHFEMKRSGQLLRKYLKANHAFQKSEDVATAIKIVPMIVANFIPMTLLMGQQASVQDIDDLVFLLGYISMFGGNILNLSQSMKACIRAVDTLDQVLRLNHLATDRLSMNISNLPLLIGYSDHYKAPMIEFENVSFAYPGSTNYVLKKISFIIHPGTHVSVVGRSSAGKSTIVKLLYGLLKPTEGHIKINGCSIEEIPAAVLSRIFCCVPQLPDFFRNKSLKYNVLYGTDKDDFLEKYAQSKFDPEQVLESFPLNYRSINTNEINDQEDDRELLYQQGREIFSKAMQKAALTDLMNSPVDAKNSMTSLSGGQRQRVSIARAIARNSSIFIFDESTSNLDAFTESTVLKHIQEITKEKTSIMITHRLSAVRDVDSIIVLENGTIAEVGSPRELLKEKGAFYNYWTSQMG